MKKFSYSSFIFLGRTIYEKIEYDDVENPVLKKDKKLGKRSLGNWADVATILATLLLIMSC